MKWPKDMSRLYEWSMWMVMSDEDKLKTARKALRAIEVAPDLDYVRSIARQALRLIGEHEEE